MGKNEGERPILVSFSSHECKKLIFSNAKNVKALNISFSNDLTREQRESRKKVYMELLECKQVLEQKGKSSSIRRNQLINNGWEFI